MQTRALVLTVLGSAVVVATAAACSGGSGGTSTPSATATVTDTVSSANPPIGSGVPASSTPAGSGTSGGGGNASGPGLCTPTVMTFAVGRGEGTAGTTHTSIIATNASSSPCVTTGWPGVAVLDASGKQIAQAARSGAEGSTITVQPGQEVHADLSSSDVPQDGSTVCTKATAILFTMPDNTDSTQIKGVPLTVCHPEVETFESGAG